MEEKIKNPSLLVPSVKELIKEKILTVPQRYIQSQNEQLVNINEGDHSILQIPVIDMKKLLSPEYGSSELCKLHLACKDWGFFQVSFLSLHILDFLIINSCIIHMHALYMLKIYNLRLLI
jgi:hypothetical protein